MIETASTGGSVRIKLLVSLASVTLLLNCSSSLAVDAQQRWANLATQGDEFERGLIGIQPERVNFNVVPTKAQRQLLEQSLKRKIKTEDASRITSILKFAPSSTSAASAKTSFSAACRLQTEKKFAEAIKSFESAIAANPFLVEADYNSGLCYQALGDPAAAIACYKRIDLISSRIPASWRRLAEALHAEDHDEEAMKVLQNYYKN